MAELTADTITDEQIRELQRSIDGRVFPATGMAHTELSEVWETCNVALAKPMGGWEWGGLLMNEQRQTARARCAEIINARGRQC